MRIRTGFASGTLGFLILINAASGQNKTCTNKEAMQAEDILDNVRTWNSMHKFYRQFSHCDDGSIAEGVSDAAAKLLANHWGSLREFARIGQSDKGFEEFVLGHVDESVSWDDGSKIHENAKLHCPSGTERLCGILLEKTMLAAQALEELFPPPRFPPGISPPPTLKTTPSTFLSLGPIQIVFGRTTLDEAMNEIKAGGIQHQGDAGESTYWLCYSIRSSLGLEHLWLLSHGEMGGPQHVIHGIAAKVSSSARRPASCPTLPDHLRAVKLNIDLWLGAELNEIGSKLGKPPLQNGEWLHYESQRELVGDPRAKDFQTDRIYERGSLSVRAVNGKIAEIWASKQTTD